MLNVCPSYWRKASSCRTRRAGSSPNYAQSAGRGRSPAAGPFLSPRLETVAHCGGANRLRAQLTVARMPPCADCLSQPARKQPVRSRSAVNRSWDLEGPRASVSRRIVPAQAGDLDPRQVRRCDLASLVGSQFGFGGRPPQPGRSLPGHESCRQTESPRFGGFRPTSPPSQRSRAVRELPTVRPGAVLWTFCKGDLRRD